MATRWPRRPPADRAPGPDLTAPGAQRAIVLVDGEHYPPVITGALDHLRSTGVQPVAAVFLGGTEKVSSYGAEVDLGIPIAWVPRAAAPGIDVAAAAELLAHLLAEHDADLVYDLSDEPIMDPRHRLQLASHVLLAGVSYSGADFALTPPPRPRLSTRPTIAVIGTGKRTGKTAVTGEIVRRLAADGHDSVVVAMGRGGPPEPVVVPAGAKLDAESLLRVAEAGGHAASDFYEDAVTTGAATVGARRCGGGLSGAVAYTNVPSAIARANEIAGEFTVLEGSGAAIPPAAADVTVLVVPADCDPEFIRGYLGPYRVLLADLVLVTMAEPPRGSPRQVDAVREAIRSISRRPLVLSTVLRPVPLDQVTGERVFFATTAPAEVSASLVEALEAQHGCEVVAASNRLADRPRLRFDLEAAGSFDVLLVELKAAAVDVATRMATEAGARVVFCDNRPVVVDDDNGVGGFDPNAVLQQAVRQLAELAINRAAEALPLP